MHPPTRRLTRSTTVSRCGCPARRPVRRMAAGSRASSPTVSGSRSSCSRAGRIGAGSLRSRHWDVSSACRSWRRATCTCTHAAGARCRMRSRRHVCAPPSSARVSRCIRTASATCGRCRGCARSIHLQLIEATLDDRCALPLLARGIALRVPARDRPRGGDTVELAATAHLEGHAPTLARWRARSGDGARRARARADRGAQLRCVFPDGARHRELCAFARHPLPGARLGGEFGRVLLPGRHRGGPGPDVAALRAVYFARAQRAARYRRRLRARAARGGHPVHLCEVRPRPRGAHRHRDLLPARAAHCGTSRRR